MDTRESVLAILKETGAFLEGHFLLSSGLHSREYVQCARVLRFPEKASAVLKTVAAQLNRDEIDVVCGPAMGGVLVSYEMGRLLDRESMFSERVDGAMTLRRGFEIKPGARILIAEDVVTTGKSTLEAKEAIEKAGGIVVGVACIADRRAAGVDVGMPVYSAISFDIQTYDPADCPLCRAGSAAVKPGSRI